ncbi:MAG: 4-hydroxy-tetrahydrodipicolinate reductase [Verrucomicrobiota bacterium]|nr:4-hydroxy-tetrahydrodipicolinate reductase [Verrucomicrobiota bacterium]
MTRVALIGAAGRMGQAIIRAAENQPDLQIAAQIEVGDALDDSLGNCEVVIDFSHADATERNCAAAIAHGKPIVIGTTGQTPAQRAVIEKAAAEIPVLLAANFSVGVNALFWLTRKANELLGDGFDLEIVETHHRLKKDAPSGTAKRLAEILCEARTLDYERDVAHGRAGLVGERPAKEIGMHAIRAGDVVGEHTVIFAGDGERLELTHKASSRETFARGALRAARWIVERPAGRYSMDDVLGL